MALPGSAGMLPTIKCSSCGADIDIEKLTDHLCAPVSANPISRPAPRSFQDAFSNMSINQSMPAPFRSRPSPNPIDPTTANGSYFGRNAWAPPARTASYTTASSIGRKPSFAPSAQSASLFPRPPSAQLSLPQDCAFPPFPLPSKGVPSKKAEDNRININESIVDRKAAHSPSTSVAGFSKPGGLSEQQQTGTGAFDSRAGEPANVGARMQGLSGPSHLAQSEYPPPLDSTISDLDTREPAPIVLKPAAPGTLDRKKSVTAANRPLDEIGSVRSHRPAASRSGISIPVDGHNQPRSASAQGFSQGRISKDGPPPIPETRSQGHDIIRSVSATGSYKRSTYGLPSRPTPAQARSDSNNVNGHTPSDSTSSDQSEASQPKTSSSQSSPPNSPPRRKLEESNRLPSKQAIQGLGIAPNQSPKLPVITSFSRPSRAQPDLSRSPPRSVGQNPDTGRPVYKAQDLGFLSPEMIETASAGPWQSSVNPASHAPSLLSPATLEQASAGPWRTQPTSIQPNSPATASGILSPETLQQMSAGPWQSAPRQDMSSSLNHRSQLSNSSVSNLARRHEFQDSASNPASTRVARPLLQISSRAPAVAPEFQESARSAIMPPTRNYGFNGTHSPLLSNGNSLRRAATTSKGKCRGCSQAITGKSVSSADGRLTGRWHKHCFTCKTCAEPFPTMDFYVLGNDPYCNRHYHQLNRSLCTSCDRGIEGQYVANEQQKFHPHCFSCTECHLILRDTYFDLNGKIFCERHAFKSNKPSLPGAGRRFPEKRSTRLMMM